MPFFPTSLPALALTVGGLPYLVVAALMYVPIRRAKSLGRLAGITLLVPLALAVLLLIFSSILAAVVVLTVSYGYIAIAWGLFALARMLGWVADAPPNTSLERTREE